VKRSVLALLLSLPGCADGAPPYAACGGDSDCDAPSGGCFRVLLTRTDGTQGDASFCSERCATDATCPSDGACLALEADTAGTFICYARCETSAECFTPLRCTPVEGAPGVSSVCMP